MNDSSSKCLRVNGFGVNGFGGNGFGINGLGRLGDLDIGCQVFQRDGVAIRFRLP